MLYGIPRLILMVAPVVWLPFQAAAQSDSAQDERSFSYQDSGGDSAPPRATKIPTEGFWPTKVMMDRIFDRVADEMASNYEMDDEQRDRTAAVFKERIVRFLEANRAEIQTLANEFFEVQLHNEAPTPEAVAAWSQRVLPLLDEFGGVADTIADDMREYFTDDQVTKLEGEMAAFKTGLTIATSKLGSWAGGQYDPEREWFAPGPARNRKEREERARMEAEMAAAQAAAEANAAEQLHAAELASGSNAPPPVSKPAIYPASMPASVPAVVDDWTLYTNDFIRRYELDSEQEQKAREFLRARQIERDRYLQRKNAEIERITLLAQNAANDEERAAAEHDADRLQAPIDRMFQQLKDKLNTLPTRAQRARAEPASRPAREATSTPATSSPANAG